MEERKSFIFIVSFEGPQLCTCLFLQNIEIIVLMKDNRIRSLLFGSNILKNLVLRWQDSLVGLKSANTEFPLSGLVIYRLSLNDFRFI